MPSNDDTLRDYVREWVADYLAKLDMVEWDRYTTDEDERVGEIINVYGWIDRPEDAYKDFVVVRFFPDTDEGLIWYLTSSDRYSEEIHRRLFGSADGHVECRRVEHTFDAPNAITLGEQTTLTDGGDGHGVHADARDSGETPADRVVLAFQPTDADGATDGYWWSLYNPTHDHPYRDIDGDSDDMVAKAREHDDFNPGDFPLRDGERWVRLDYESVLNGNPKRVTSDGRWLDAE